MMRSPLLLLAPILALSAACSGVPCSSQSDCDQGFYCSVSIGSSGVDGTCERDCVVPSDCQVGDPARTLAICGDQGRCRTTPRPPRLRILTPENDSLLEEGTRRVRLTGEVETFADTFDLEYIVSSEGCLTAGRRVTIQNPTPGEVATVPFILDNVAVDPGLTRLSVIATADGVRDKVDHLVEVPCPGCAKISISQPMAVSGSAGYAAQGLELERLAGRVDPPAVSTAIWRVRNEDGDVMDGLMRVDNGAFSAERLPIFAGRNTAEVVVTGVGDGLGEARCTLTVNAGVPSERGLRLLLTWDGPTSDLDLHLVGPGGQYLDADTDLFSRSPSATFGGEVRDDFDGLGPETITVESLPDGVYGIVVEPFSDGLDPGSDAFLRVFHDGRLLFPGAAGPRYLTVRDLEVWVVGTVEISGSAATWRSIDELVSATSPPQTSPELWPTFQ